MRGALDGKSGALRDSTCLAVPISARDRTAAAPPPHAARRPRLAPLHRRPAVMRYWHPGPDVDLAATAARIAEIEAHWLEHGFGDWASWRGDSAELIGFAGLHRIAGMDAVNLATPSHPPTGARGLGRELCATLLEHGFAASGSPRSSPSSTRATPPPSRSPSAAGSASAARPPGRASRGSSSRSRRRSSRRGVEASIQQADQGGSQRRRRPHRRPARSQPPAVRWLDGRRCHA